MDLLFYFALGVLFTLLMTQKPIKIEVHHKHENIIPVQNDLNMIELEQKMLDADPKLDKQYEDLDKIIAEANNIREDKYNPYYDSVNGHDYEILEEWEKITRNFVYNDLKVSDSEFQADIQNSYDYSSSSIRENGKKYFARVKQ